MVKVGWNLIYLYICAISCTIYNMHHPLATKQVIIFQYRLSSWGLRWNCFSSQTNAYVLKYSCMNCGWMPHFSIKLNGFYGNSPSPESLIGHWYRVISQRNVNTSYSWHSSLYLAFLRHSVSTQLRCLIEFLNSQELSLLLGLY